MYICVYTYLYVCGCHRLMSGIFLNHIPSYCEAESPTESGADQLKQTSCLESSRVLPSAPCAGITEVMSCCPCSHRDAGDGS